MVASEDHPLYYTDSDNPYARIRFVDGAPALFICVGERTDAPRFVAIELWGRGGPSLGYNPPDGSFTLVVRATDALARKHAFVAYAYNSANDAHKEIHTFIHAKQPWELDGTGITWDYTLAFEPAMSQVVAFATAAFDAAHANSIPVNGIAAGVQFDCLALDVDSSIVRPEAIMLLNTAKPSVLPGDTTLAKYAEEARSDASGDETEPVIQFIAGVAVHAVVPGAAAAMGPMYGPKDPWVFCHEYFGRLPVYFHRNGRASDMKNIKAALPRVGGPSPLRSATPARTGLRAEWVKGAAWDLKVALHNRLDRPIGDAKRVAVDAWNNVAAGTPKSQDAPTIAGIDAYLGDPAGRAVQDGELFKDALYALQNFTKSTRELTADRYISIEEMLEDEDDGEYVDEDEGDDEETRNAKKKKKTKKIGTLACASTVALPAPSSAPRTFVFAVDPAGPPVVYDATSANTVLPIFFHKKSVPQERGACDQRLVFNKREREPVLFHTPMSAIVANAVDGTFSAVDVVQEGVASAYEPGRCMRAPKAKVNAATTDVVPLLIGPKLVAPHTAARKVRGGNPIPSRKRIESAARTLHNETRVRNANYRSGLELAVMSRSVTTLQVFRLWHMDIVREAVARLCLFETGVVLKAGGLGIPETVGDAEGAVPGTGKRWCLPEFAAGEAQGLLEDDLFQYALATFPQEVRPGAATDDINGAPPVAPGTGLKTDLRRAHMLVGARASTTTPRPQPATNRTGWISDASETHALEGAVAPPWYTPTGLGFRNDIDHIAIAEGGKYQPKILVHPAPPRTVRLANGAVGRHPGVYIKPSKRVIGALEKALWYSSSSIVDRAAFIDTRHVSYKNKEPVVASLPPYLDESGEGAPLPPGYTTAAITAASSTQQSNVQDISVDAYPSRNAIPGL